MQSKVSILNKEVAPISEGVKSSRVEVFYKVSRAFLHPKYQEQQFLQGFFIFKN